MDSEEDSTNISQKDIKKNSKRWKIFFPSLCSIISNVLKYPYRETFSNKGGELIIGSSTQSNAYIIVPALDDAVASGRSVFVRSNSKENYVKDGRGQLFVSHVYEIKTARFRGWGGFQFRFPIHGKLRDTCYLKVICKDDESGEICEVLYDYNSVNHYIITEVERPKDKMIIYAVLHSDNVDVSECILNDIYLDVLVYGPRFVEHCMCFTVQVKFTGGEKSRKPTSKRVSRPNEIKHMRRPLVIEKIQDIKIGLRIQGKASCDWDTEGDTTITKKDLKSGAVQITFPFSYKNEEKESMRPFNCILELHPIEGDTPTKMPFKVAARKRGVTSRSTSSMIKRSFSTCSGRGMNKHGPIPFATQNKSIDCCTLHPCTENFMRSSTRSSTRSMSDFSMCSESPSVADLAQFASPSLSSLHSLQYGIPPIHDSANRRHSMTDVMMKSDEREYVRCAGKSGACSKSDITRHVNCLSEGLSYNQIGLDDCLADTLSSGDKWKDVARQLRCKDSDISAFEHEEPVNWRERVIKMLRKAENMYPCNEFLARLVNALIKSDIVKQTLVVVADALFYTIADKSAKAQFNFMSVLQLQPKPKCPNSDTSRETKTDDLKTETYEALQEEFAASSYDMSYICKLRDILSDETRLQGFPGAAELAKKAAGLKTLAEMLSTNSKTI